LDDDDIQMLPKLVVPLDSITNHQCFLQLTGGFDYFMEEPTVQVEAEDYFTVR